MRCSWLQLQTTIYIPNIQNRTDFHFCNLRKRYLAGFTRSYPRKSDSRNTAFHRNTQTADTPCCRGVYRTRSCIQTGHVSMHGIRIKTQAAICRNLYSPAAFLWGYFSAGFRYACEAAGFRRTGKYPVCQICRYEAATCPFCM